MGIVMSAVARDSVVRGPHHQSIALGTNTAFLAPTPTGSLGRVARSGLSATVVCVILVHEDASTDGPAVVDTK
jgi:hypothetical protein